MWIHYIPPCRVDYHRIHYIPPCRLDSHRIHYIPPCRADSHRIHYIPPCRLDSHRIIVKTPKTLGSIDTAVLALIRRKQTNCRDCFLKTIVSFFLQVLYHPFNLTTLSDKFDIVFVKSQRFNGRRPIFILQNVIRILFRTNLINLKDFKTVFTLNICFYSTLQYL